MRATCLQRPNEWLFIIILAWKKFEDMIYLGHSSVVSTCWPQSHLASDLWSLVALVPVLESKIEAYLR